MLLSQQHALDEHAGMLRAIIAHIGVSYTPNPRPPIIPRDPSGSAQNQPLPRDTHVIKTHHQAPVPMEGACKVHVVDGGIGFAQPRTANAVGNAARNVALSQLPPSVMWDDVTCWPGAGHRNSDLSQSTMLSHTRGALADHRQSPAVASALAHSPAMAKVCAAAERRGLELATGERWLDAHVRLEFPEPGVNRGGVRGILDGDSSRLEREMPALRSSTQRQSLRRKSSGPELTGTQFF